MVSLALSIPLTIITILGLLLNGYIIVVIIITKQVATANNLLVLHLGAVGALLGVLSLSGWVTDGPACTIGGYLHSLLHPVALWTICGLNCDRYCAISAPLHYAALVSPKKVVCGLVCTWIAALALSIPPLLGTTSYKSGPPLGGCTPDFNTASALWYCLIYAIFTLIVPAALVVACNLKILMIARYHRHRIASAIYEVTLSAQVTITHQRNPFFVPIVTSPNAPRVRNRSAISTVLQLVGSFIILYFPYYMVILWQSISAMIQHETNGRISTLKLSPHLITLALSFLTCSPPINGVLYGIKSKLLRKTFQNYWRKKMMKSEMNQEIQARTPSTCGSRRPSITPLGMMNKPCLQRRLSEALIDISRSANSPQRNNKIKRIASEHAWKTGITFNGLDSPPIAPKPERAIAHTSSCNTLQVPCTDAENAMPQLKEDEAYLSFKSSFKSHDHSNPRTSAIPIPRPAMSTANLILQRVFGLEGNHENVPNRRARPRPSVSTALAAKRSPRILITRAFSEESEKAPSMPESPNREAISKKYSCSTTTLLERKWKVLRMEENCKLETDSDSDFCEVRKKEIVHNNTAGDDSSGGNNSDSSSAGEDDNRKYVSLEEHYSNAKAELAAEEQLLLSWPATKKRPQKLRPNGILSNASRPLYLGNGSEAIE